MGDGEVGGVVYVCYCVCSIICGLCDSLVVVPSSLCPYVSICAAGEGGEDHLITWYGCVCLYRLRSPLRAAMAQVN